MYINKKMREKVYLKYNKHCAYCGKNLETIKDMQVDHKEPLAINNNPDIDNNRFENLMPSCRRCNHYKRAHSLDYFRGLIDTLHKRIAKDYIVRVAIDYGLLEFNEFDGLFYFERATNASMAYIPC